MKVTAVSFTGKTPKPTQIKNAYEKAMAETLEHSDKDYFNLSKKTNKTTDNSDLIADAKKFFSNSTRAIKEYFGQ